MSQSPEGQATSVGSRGGKVWGGYAFSWIVLLRRNGISKRFQDTPWPPGEHFENHGNHGIHGCHGFRCVRLPTGAARLEFKAAPRSRANPAKRLALAGWKGCL